jgi:uncharacterized heparinase superfamily protein
MNLGTALRYARTLRHLRPVQIGNRVWRRLHRPRFARTPAPPLRAPRSAPAPFVARDSAFVDPHTLRFLEDSRAIGAAGIWNAEDVPNLWLYNLHYFDELQSPDAVSRDAWLRALLRRWIDENPPGEGIGWEPYPSSRRIVNLVKWALQGNVPGPDLLDSLALQARCLAGRLEYHLLGNHLLANAKALIFAGCYFRGAEADAWLTRGLHVLSAQVQEQVLSDGGHFELSPMYHGVVLEDLLDVINIGRCSDAVPPRLLDELARAVAAMRRWLAAMTHPDGGVAFFNDTAGAGVRVQERLDAYSARLGLGAVAAPGAGITHLAASGFVRLQSGPAILFADVGEVGPAYLPGHAHADTLSFELSLAGTRLFVNSGTSTYAAGAERDFQRSTRAHNTVEVDGESSSETWGSFRVARRAHPFDLRCEQAADGGLEVSCAHTGYRRLRGRVTHTRTWRLRQTSLVVADRLEGEFRDASSRIHLGPDWAAVLPQLSCGTLRVDVAATGGIAATRSTYHPDFGRSIPNTCLTMQMRPGHNATDFRWTGHEDPVLF